MRCLCVPFVLLLCAYLWPVTLVHFCPEAFTFLLVRACLGPKDAVLGDSRHIQHLKGALLHRLREACTRAWQCFDVMTHCSGFLFMLMKTHLT